jgi:hypothetical protein
MTALLPTPTRPLAESPPPLDPDAEAFAARLARAAYEVALKHGVRGAFPDLELGLWKELREVVRERGTHPDRVWKLVRRRPAN